jgi:hypothetical protein
MQKTHTLKIIRASAQTALGALLRNKQQTELGFTRESPADIAKRAESVSIPVDSPLAFTYKYGY